MCVCVWCRAVWPEPIYSKMCPLTNRSQNINQPMKIKGGSLTIFKILEIKLIKCRKLHVSNGSSCLEFQQQQGGHLTLPRSLTASLIPLIFLLLLPVLDSESWMSETSVILRPLHDSYPAPLNFLVSPTLSSWRSLLRCHLICRDTWKPTLKQNKTPPSTLLSLLSFISPDTI